MAAGVNHARRTAIRRFRWHSMRVRQPVGHHNATVNGRLSAIAAPQVRKNLAVRAGRNRRIGGKEPA
jgi:hypothetical protein